jgi:cytoskeletal protein CcmA (bactofilin family)
VAHLRSKRPGTCSTRRRRWATAEIKGSFAAGRLVIPAANHFRWPQTIKVQSAEIAGELAASLSAEDQVTIRSTGRLFGDVEAGRLVVEAGAIVVGRARIGAKKD